MQSRAVQFMSGIWGKCNFLVSATAIHTRTYQIPSDLWSQAGNGSVSTMVGDHMGILSAVVFSFCFEWSIDEFTRFQLFSQCTQIRCKEIKFLLVFGVHWHDYWVLLDFWRIRNGAKFVSWYLNLAVKEQFQHVPKYNPVIKYLCIKLLLII